GIGILLRVNLQLDGVTSLRQARDFIQLLLLLQRRAVGIDRGRRSSTAINEDLRLAMVRTRISDNPEPRPREADRGRRSGPVARMIIILPISRIISPVTITAARSEIRQRKTTIRRGRGVIVTVIIVHIFPAVSVLEIIDRHVPVSGN